MGEASNLCGGCQQWGCNPLLANGRCTACDRTPAEIMRDHGILDVVHTVPAAAQPREPQEG
jgi:hypothetical protein